MSKLEVDKVVPQSGTTLTVGEVGDTTVINGLGTLPATIGTSTQVLAVNAGATGLEYGTAATDLSNLNATNLTSGTVPDLRFPSVLPAAGGQNLTSLQSAALTGALPAISGASLINIPANQGLQNDIATLALHQATFGNATRYNLTNTNVDVYEDSTAIANLVTVARSVSGEFMSTAIASGATAQAITGITVAGGNIVRTSPEATAIANAEDGAGSTQVAYTTGSSVSGYVTADLGATYTIAQMDLGKKRAAGDPRSILMSYSTDDSLYPVMDLTSATSTVVSYGGESKNLSNFTSAGTADWAALTVNDYNSVCRVTDFATFSARYLRYKFGSADFHDANAAWSQFKIYKQGFTTGAAGSYESTAQTANASTSIVSAVLTYTDSVGTTALNTDLVLQVSADNGVTFTSAPLTAAGSFSSGILQATTSDITVTAGSQIKYKVTFANQAALTKVTQVNGVSLIY